MARCFLYSLRFDSRHSDRRFDNGIMKHYEDDPDNNDNNSDNK